MSEALGRKAIDHARAAQALLLLIATVFPVVADAQDEAEGVVAAVGLLITAYLEIKKRQSVTPVADPKDANGDALIPVH